MGKVNSHNMRNFSHLKVMGFSNILGEAEIDTTPKIWEKRIYIVQGKYGKTQRDPILFTTSQIYS